GVAPGRVLAGRVSSAASPTLSSHNVATATASHSRAWSGKVHGDCAKGYGSRTRDRSPLCRQCSTADTPSVFPLLAGRALRPCADAVAPRVVSGGSGTGPYSLHPPPPHRRPQRARGYPPAAFTRSTSYGADQT